MPSTKTCKQFGYSGWSEVATEGVVSGISRPSGLLPQATATGCTGAFCSFVPQNAPIRQALHCAYVPLRNSRAGCPSLYMHACVHDLPPACLPTPDR